MKTNNVIVRPMGGFSVSQRTKDGMFNATGLLKQWNAYVDSGILDTQKIGYVKKKDLDDYFNNKATKEFLNALVLEENLDTQNSAYVKSRASRGDNAGTWMHPLLFIDFAMWLNPMFKVKVIKFVYDKMLEYREENCEAYKELCTAICKIVDKSMQQASIQSIAKALNIIVFGKHEHEARNKNGVEEKQKELWELERHLTNLINEGFLTKYDNVMNYLRKKWFEKYSPKIFNK